MRIRIIILLVVWSIMAVAVGAEPSRGGEEAGGEPGPGRLLKAKGSSWVWFLDSFGTRHRIVSQQVRHKWWADGPRVEEVSVAELEKHRVGEEIDYGTNPYTYVLSRDSRIIRARLGSDSGLDRLRAVLGGGSAKDRTPAARPSPTPSPESTAPDEPEHRPSEKPVVRTAPRPEATVRVQSSPAGAQVYRVSDHKLLGVTPLTVTAKPGAISLSFVLKGHLKVRKRLTLAPGENPDLRVRFTLAPSPQPSPAPAENAQTIPLRWSALGEIEAFLQPGEGDASVSRGLTEVFRLSLPGGTDAVALNPSSDRAAGNEPGRGIWILSLSGDAPSLRRIDTPGGLKEAQLSWLSDRDLLISDPQEQERFLVNTDQLTVKRPKAGALAHVVDPRSRTWVNRSDVASRPEVLKLLQIREVPGESNMLAGLALSADGKLVCGIARENPRKPVLISMGTGKAIELPEPGEDLTNATLSWMTGNRILLWVPGKGSFALSFESLTPAAVREMASSLSNAGQPDESLRMYQRLEHYYPGSPEAVAAKVEIARMELKKAATLEEKEPREALKLYQAVIASQPAGELRQTAQTAATALARKLETAQIDQNRQELTKVLQEIRTTMAGGDLERALALAQRARQLAPEAPQVKEMVSALEKVRAKRELELHQKRAISHYNTAVSLAKQGMYAQAADEAVLSLKEDPGHAGSQNLLLELSESAVPRPRAPGEQRPGDAEMAQHLQEAREHLAAGRLDQARAAVGTVLANAPEQVDARKLAADIRQAQTPAASPSPAPSGVASIPPASPAVVASAPAASPSPLTSAAAAASPQTTQPVAQANEAPVPGCRWVYTFGPGTLVRRAIETVRVKSEVGVLIEEHCEVQGYQTTRYEVLVNRPNGLFRVARGKQAKGSFRPLDPEEVVVRYPLQTGAQWATARGHVVVTAQKPAAVGGVSFPNAYYMDEVVRHIDPLDTNAKLLTYPSIFVPGVGIVRQGLQRQDGAVRPILDLESFAPAAVPTASAPESGPVSGPAPVYTAVALTGRTGPAPKIDPTLLASQTVRTDSKGPSTYVGNGGSDEEGIILDKGESHFQQARNQLARHFPIEARNEIEAALSFDPQNKEYLKLKRQILANLVAHAPYRPATFGLDTDELDILRTYGIPDRIEPLTSNLKVRGRAIPYDLVLTYRGSPYGAPPAESEAEPASDDLSIGDTDARQQMSRWRLFLRDHRVVARQVTYRGDFQRANFPRINRRLPEELLTRPHDGEAGALSNTRKLSWDLGTIQVATSVLTLPRRRYDSKKGYVFDPPRHVSDYQVTRALVSLDPETGAQPPE